MSRRTIIVQLTLAAFLLALILPPTVPASDRPVSTDRPAMVIVADPESPYAPLAAEIAAAESAPLVPALAGLADVAPAYVIWVATPQALNEAALMELSALLRASAAPPAVGIITGSTLDKARDLWLRDRELRLDPPGTKSNLTLIAAGAGDINDPRSLIRVFPTANGSAGIIDAPLTKTGLLDALTRADYLYWARHVSKTAWYWYEGEFPNDDESLRAEDLPALPPIIIHSPSCSSFTPWAEDSIALAFIDHGAAAYLGHVYPPISSGVFIGHITTPPGIQSWPGVPMGTIAQVQARASERATVAMPNFFMLGDPRLAVQAETPYEITGDVSRGSRRTITGTWTATTVDGRGVLPVRIADAGDARFVRVRGVGAVAENDPFYNGRVQAINTGRDKIVLIQNPPATFELTLRRQPPLFWRLLDPLRDGLEFAWISMRPIASPIALVPFGVLIAIIAIATLRRRPLPNLKPAAGAGAILALLQLAVFVLCAKHVQITSYSITGTPWDTLFGALGTWALVTAGLLWSTGARRRMGRLLGILLAAAPELYLATFHAAFITLINVSQAQRSTIAATDGTALWPLNYAFARLGAIALIIMLWAVTTARHRIMMADPGSSKLST